MQHEAVSCLLHFVKLHSIPVRPEQIVPQQCCPFTGSARIKAGSSRAFNAPVQGNRDRHGLRDLRTGKISKK